MGCREALSKIPLSQPRVSIFNFDPEFKIQRWNMTPGSIFYRGQNSLLHRLVLRGANFRKMGMSIHFKRHALPTDICLLQISFSVIFIKHLFLCIHSVINKIWNLIHMHCARCLIVDFVSPCKISLCISRCVTPVCLRFYYNNPSMWISQSKANSPE